MTKEISTDNCVLLVRLLSAEKDRIHREMKGFGLGDVRRIENIETLIDNLNLMAINPHEVVFLPREPLAQPDYVDFDIWTD